MAKDKDVSALKRFLVIAWLVICLVLLYQAGKTAWGAYQTYQAAQEYVKGLNVGEETKEAQDTDAAPG